MQISPHTATGLCVYGTLISCFGKINSSGAKINSVDPPQAHCAGSVYIECSRVKALRVGKVTRCCLCVGVGVGVSLFLCR